LEIAKGIAELDTGAKFPKKEKLKEKNSLMITQMT
jgi:hypothetical protein